VHPATEQCPARSKRTGLPCKRLVTGGGVCYLHGGRARQVAAKREQRILLAEARAKALPAVVEPQKEATADEILISLLSDVRDTLRSLKAEMVGNPSPALLILLGDWIDRCDRISRSVIITRAEERVEQRRVMISETQADQLSTLLFVAITETDLSARQRVDIMDHLLAALPPDDLPILAPGQLAGWINRTRAQAEAERAVPGSDEEILASLEQSLS
jgi:hypothetical protein